MAIIEFNNIPNTWKAHILIMIFCIFCLICMTLIILTLFSLIGYIIHPHYEFIFTMNMNDNMKTAFQVMNKTM